MNQTKARCRCGVTLVELLIVVSMIVILLAIALPTLKLAMESRRTREASRMVNSYFYVAQSRAAELGRPVGVWIERDPKDPNQAYQLYLAEVPPPYSGDAFDTTAEIHHKDNASNPSGDDGLVKFNSDSFSISLPILVQDGDAIRFNFKGPYYRLYNVPTTTGTGPYWVNIENDDVPLPRGPALVSDPGVEVSYQILRQPIRTSANSIELPRNTIIDLRYSGIGGEGIEFEPSGASDTTPIIILFSPAGGVLSYSVQGTGLVRPAGPIHLLIGENVDTELDNLQNQENLWISIGHASGSITSSENLGGRLNQARRFARQAQTLGGG